MSKEEKIRAIMDLAQGKRPQSGGLVIRLQDGTYKVRIGGVVKSLTEQEFRKFNFTHSIIILPDNGRGDSLI